MTPRSPPRRSGGRALPTLVCAAGYDSLALERIYLRPGYVSKAAPATTTGVAESAAVSPVTNKLRIDADESRAQYREGGN